MVVNQFSKADRSATLHLTSAIDVDCWHITM